MSNDFDIDAREADITGKPQRIEPLLSEDFDDDAKALVVRIRATLGVGTEQMPEVFGLMLRHPGLFAAQMEMGIQLLGKGSLPARERELAILRVGWRCRAPYEWGEHVDIAKRNGVTPAEVERVTAGAGATGWTPHEAAILRGVDELFDNQMLSDATWGTLAETWDERQLLEFPTLVGQYFATALLQNSLRVRLAHDNAGLRQR